MSGKFLDQIRFGADGLVLAIIQDCVTREVLMAAYQDRRAVELSLETGRMHFFSRSRKKLWIKGETSGHAQQVREVLLDCDGDALLYRVEQSGGACHLGYRTCFFRALRNGETAIVEERVFDPENVYPIKE